jgi:O-antigen biosynthesis protein
MTIKRALICSPVLPEYDREGGSRRVFHLIEFLLEAGWSVTLIAQNGTNGARYIKQLQQLGVEVYLGTETELAGDEFLADPAPLIKATQFDLAILVFWFIGEGILPLIRSLSPNTRILLDSIDFHSLREARALLRVENSSQQPKRLSDAFGVVFAREFNTYAGSDAVLTVSDKEAALLSDFLARDDFCYNVPLMEDLAVSPHPFAKRKGLLFIGNFRHTPNVEAVEYLCKDIIPLIDPQILEEHPLYIVGNALDEKIASFTKAIKNVRLVGWVPSLVPYLQQTKISLVPLLHGAGTKTKVIQTLMAGTPCISTNIGTEGLNLQDEEHVLIANNPAAFAEAVNRLINDKALWEKLALQGKNHIEIAHGREAVRQSFWRAVTAVMHRSPQKARNLLNL